MFDYQGSKDLISTIQVQKSTIENLNRDNLNLRQQLIDYKTNLELNKDAIKDLVASMKPEEENNGKSKSHERRSSWWGTSTKSSNQEANGKVHLVNTINKLVTENLNLQNEVFRIQELFDQNLKESAELRLQSSLSLRGKKRTKTQNAETQTELLTLY